MQHFVPIFSLLVAVAGWFYLFNSRAALRLAGVEAARLNARRVLLRRMGGVVMILLAIGIYAGLVTIDADQRPREFVLIWLGVFVLLAVMIVLAMLDVRLTLKLRRDRSKI